jgi:hypothetical protein
VELAGAGRDAVATHSYLTYIKPGTYLACSRDAYGNARDRTTLQPPDAGG